MMGMMSIFFHFFCGIVIGVITQGIFQWPPWVYLILSFGLSIFLPPDWSMGILSGLWISCAYFTAPPEKDNRHDKQAVVGWHQIFISSLFTFSGFLLTLLLVWKLKTTPFFKVIGHRELIGWSFLILMEISFYRITARFYTIWQRTKVGLGIGFLNFLMVLFWVLPYGWIAVLLTFISLLFIGPSLLIWVDRPIRENDGIL